MFLISLINMTMVGHTWTKNALWGGSAGPHWVFNSFVGVTHFLKMFYSLYMNFLNVSVKAISLWAAALIMGQVICEWSIHARASIHGAGSEKSSSGFKDAQRQIAALNPWFTHKITSSKTTPAIYLKHPLNKSLCFSRHEFRKFIVTSLYLSIQLLFILPFEWECPGQ